MRYQTLLMDADDTLFDFHAAEREAFALLAKQFSLPGDEQTYALYHSINAALWKELEQGLTTKPALLTKRFRRLNAELGIKTDNSADMHAYYAAALGRQAILFPDARDICRKLANICRLYMVTNGNKSIQLPRFEQAGILPFFQDIFISDDIGHPKPKKEFFSYVANHIPNYVPHSTLIVGDSLSSDIQGGHNAGLDTAWFNPSGAKCTLDILPTYTIRSLDELFAILQ